eukprot:4900529-Pyramimonas_sp.AAC.1
MGIGMSKRCSVCLILSLLEPTVGERVAGARPAGSEAQGFAVQVGLLSNLRHRPASRTYGNSLL